MFPSLSSGFLHSETQNDFSASRLRQKLFDLKKTRKNKELEGLKPIHKKSTDVSENESKEIQVE
jgi:hypothetical protein